MNAQAWTRETLASADWTVALPAAAIDELLAVRDEIRRAPVPTFLLDPIMSSSIVRCKFLLLCFGEDDGQWEWCGADGQWCSGICLWRVSTVS